MKIRRLQQGEEEIYSEVVQIMASVLGKTYPQHFDYLLNQHAITTEKTFAAFIDGKLVGGAIYDIDWDSMNLTGKYAAVLPEFQGRGVGKGLVRSLELFAKKSGFKGISVDIKTPKTGESTVSEWMQRQGYQEFGRLGEQVYLNKKF